jgi:glc operon protein GlcG
MIEIRILSSVALLVLSLPLLGLACVEGQQHLTYEQASIAVDAAEAEAQRNGWNLTILVADSDGVPIQLRRMEGASARSYEVAMAKVRTALVAGMHTANYGQALAAGQTDTIPDGIPFDGGYLVRLESRVVGAMSASGARGSEDAQAVLAGLAAIGARP